MITATLLACFLAGWWINGWRWEAKQYAAEQKIIKQSLETKKLAEDYELLKQSKEQKRQDVTRQIIVESSTVAYDCRIPDNGLRLLNTAIENANSSKP